MAVLGCSALLLGILVPIVAAHHQTGAPGMVNPIVGGGVHVDTNRDGGAATGVSGTYVSSEDGVYVSVDGLPTITVGDITLFPTGAFVVSAGGALCDVEVLGDGTGGVEDQLLDETIVDSVPAGLAVPNGLFDDGGIGGACHVTSYSNAGYNAPGCPATAKVHAEDAVSGAGVWIGAACDVTLSAPGGTPEAEVFALCIVNTLIQGPTVPELSACVGKFISCTTPGNDCTVPAPPVCGTDNVSDTINFGTGNGHAAAAAGDVAFVADPSCSTAGGSAQVFTFDSVRVHLADPTSSTVSVATTGWIDQL